MPSRQHLRHVKQNKVVPPDAKEANCTPLCQEVTHSPTKDIRDLLHGMHTGILHGHFNMDMPTYSMLSQLRLKIWCTFKASKVYLPMVVEKCLDTVEISFSSVRPLISSLKDMKNMCIKNCFKILYRMAAS